MNFFAKELSKITDEFIGVEIIGRAAYIPLGENNRLKLEFETSNVQDHYDEITLTVIDKLSGIIDKTSINFTDMWGEKNVHDQKIKPHIWRSDKDAHWYIYTPTPYDMELLEEQVTSYAELFAEQELRQNMSMAHQM